MSTKNNTGPNTDTLRDATAHVRLDRHGTLHHHALSSSGLEALYPRAKLPVDAECRELSE